MTHSISYFLTFFYIFSTFSKRLFTLGISIAHETPSPEEAGQSLIDQYGEIVVEAVQLMSQWGNPNAKLKEEYPIPIREIDGKKYGS